MQSTCSIVKIYNRGRGGVPKNKEATKAVDYNAAKNAPSLNAPSLNLPLKNTPLKMVIKGQVF